MAVPQSPQGELELLDRQLHALAAWHATRRAVEAAARPRAGSRELRMDLARRLEVLHAQHAAIVERTALDLAASVRPLRRRAPLRAVVGHRNEWFADRLCADLTVRGVVVVARSGHGAEVVGAATAEQPDLVVVADRLAMLPSEDVVREVRAYVPRAVVAVQVAHDDGVEPMLRAGATAAYLRRVPPPEVSADLVRLLAGQLQDA